MSSGRIPSVEGGIQPTIVDAKGDLIVATAADTVSRLAVGSNDQVLTADSTTATGLKWATASAGGMTLISEQTASASTSLTFGSIPGTYKQLYLIWSGVFTSDNSDFALRFNNDSAGNYYNFNSGAAGGAFSAGNSSGSTSIFTLITNITGTTLNVRGIGYIIIDNYASTSKLKTVFANRGWVRAGDTTMQIYSGVYDSTSAITSLDLVRTGGTGTFSNATNTSFRLYGVS